MNARPPLTPVPYARRTEPSKSLANGAKYTPAVHYTGRSNNELWAKFKTMLPAKDGKQ